MALWKSVYLSSLFPRTAFLVGKNYFLCATRVVLFIRKQSSVHIGYEHIKVVERIKGLVMGGLQPRWLDQKTCCGVEHQVDVLRQE